MTPPAMIVIGASAGAVEALTTILPELPATLPAAIVIVVHMGAQDPGLLPGLFGPRCRMAVKEGEDKESLVSNTIYFAPVDYHLLVEKDLTLSLSCDEPVNFSRPSIDVLFESAAAIRSARVLAIVLSGANSDGAAGANEIALNGGTIFVQSPETAMSDAMPAAAIEQCPGAVVIPLAEIATQVLRWIGESAGARR
jgi:two-component system chemotaxis response regulator CheB